MQDEPDFIVPPPGLLPEGPQRDAPRPDPVAPVSPTFAPGITAPRLPTLSPMPPVTTPHFTPDEVDDTIRSEARVEAAAIDEATAMRSPDRQAVPTAGVWRLTGAGGFSLVVDSQIVLGRDPDVARGGADARAVPLDDPARSVSKTHALLEPGADGALQLTDLNSTNGCRIWPEDGELTPLVPGVATAVPDHATVLFGDLGMRVDRAPAGTV